MRPSRFASFFSFLAAERAGLALAARAGGARRAAASASSGHQRTAGRAAASVRSGHAAPVLRRQHGRCAGSKLREPPAALAQKLASFWALPTARESGAAGRGSGASVVCAARSAAWRPASSTALHAGSARNVARLHGATRTLVLLFVPRRGASAHRTARGVLSAARRGADAQQIQRALAARARVAAPCGGLNSQRARGAAHAAHAAQRACLIFFFSIGEEKEKKRVGAGAADEARKPRRGCAAISRPHSRAAHPHRSACPESS